MQKLVTFHPNIVRLADSGVFRTPPRVVWLSKISETGLRDFTRQFNLALASGQTVVPVCVDSFGGDIYAMAGIIDTLASAPVPVATFTMSKAMSAAAVILASGTPGLRYVSQRAHIMVHDVSSWAEGTSAEMANDSRHVERLNQEMMAALDAAAGKKAGYFSRLISRNKGNDVFMSAEEAVKHGIADTVGTPVFHVRVTQETWVDTAGD